MRVIVIPRHEGQETKEATKLYFGDGRLQEGAQ